MSSRLGTLLVREALLTPTQHLTAVEQAEDLGQPLITAILSLGYLSEDRLVEVLHRTLLVPVATPEMLMSPSPEALRAVHSEMARQFLLIPFAEGAQGSLLVAMADASDGHAMDEVTYHSGRRVTRYVATQSAIRWAIGHHFGLDLGQPNPPWDTSPPEEIFLLTKVKTHGMRPTAAEAEEGMASSASTLLGYSPEGPLPPPPAPAAGAPKPPPMVCLPTPDSSAQTTSPPVDGVAYSPTPVTPASHRDDVHEETEEASSLRRRRETLLGLPTRHPPGTWDPRHYGSPGPEPQSGAPELGKVVGRQQAADGAVPDRHPLETRSSQKAGLWSSSHLESDGEELSEAFGLALAAMNKPQSRDEIARALMTYFEAFFFNVLFLVVRQDRLVGWRGGGTRITPATASRIDVPLWESSTLRDAVQGRLVLMGPLGHTTADLAFQRQLGYSPQEVCLAPVAVHGQVVALLYGDGANSRIPAGELDAILSNAERAYQTVMDSTKHRR